MDTLNRENRSFVFYVWVAMMHSLWLIFRRKRSIMVALLCLLPAALPLIIAFLSTNTYADSTLKLFVKVVESLYFPVMAPLLALFFGTMLLGEDIESELFSYFLTRPIHRSALVIGRFFMYCLISFFLLIPSIWFTLFSASVAGDTGLTWTSSEIALHYSGAMCLAIIAYGAFTMFLGVISRWPLVIGIVFLFAWQRLAMMFPGAVDFLTIEKYVNTLYPKLPTQRENIVLQTAVMEYQKIEILVTGPQSLAILFGLTLTLVTATIILVRAKEFTRARNAALN